MTGILTLCRNNIALTRQLIWSALRQDVAVTIRAIDNGSSDRTDEWLRAYGWLLARNEENFGVSKGWNQGLNVFFEHWGFESVLVVGNDCQLAPWTVRLLESYSFPFTTGVASDDIKEIEQPMPPKLHLEQHPDFSCFLIRRDLWRKVGQFDERMKHYCSDCDYHIRAHRLGIPLYKVVVPFYHQRSSTMRNAKPEEAAEIQAQANRDRAVFQSLYNCLPGDPNYEAIFAQSPTSQKAPVQGLSDSNVGTGT